MVCFLSFLLVNISVFVLRCKDTKNIDTCQEKIGKNFLEFFMEFFWGNFHVKSMMRDRSAIPVGSSVDGQPPLYFSVWLDKKKGRPITM
jgi:hypothetical protein